MRQPSQDLDRPHSRLSKRAAILTCQRSRVNTRSTTDSRSLAPRPLGNSYGFVIDPVPLEARKGGPVAVVEEGLCFRSLPNTVRPSLRSVTRKIPARVDFEDISLQGDARRVSQGHRECRIGLRPAHNGQVVREGDARLDRLGRQEPRGRRSRLLTQRPEHKF